MKEILPVVTGSHTTASHVMVVKKLDTTVIDVLPPLAHPPLIYSYSKSMKILSHIPALTMTAVVVLAPLVLYTLLTRRVKPLSPMMKSPRVTTSSLISFFHRFLAALSPPTLSSLIVNQRSTPSAIKTYSPTSVHILKAALLRCTPMVALKNPPSLAKQTTLIPYGLTTN